MIIGQQVTPTLKLVRPLGQGAMGSVWVADHLALGTQVAVKFIAPAYAEEPELVARFRREAMAAAQIKSPHVAQVFDHGVTAEGAPYIVMELLEGETLKSRILRLGPLPLLDIVRIVGQATKALSRAHQLGIVHRDIKPDNLFLMDVGGEPFVKVLDFGIAKQERGGELGMTATGSMLGTPFFMSPEQLLSSKHVDFRADLWALAVSIYQALTGELPFKGETLGALSVAVHAGVFTPPSALQPGLPVTVDAWMARALQRELPERFGSAREMAEALEQVTGVTRATTTSGWDLDPAASVAAAGGAGAQDNARKLSESESGAHARTLAGMAATGAGGGKRRAPVIVAGILVVALVGVGAGLLVKGRGGAGEEAATPPASAAAATPGASTPAQAEPAPRETPTIALSSTASADDLATATAVAPPARADTPASASATPTAAALAQPPAAAGPSWTTAAKAPPSAAKQPPKRPKDDIGF